MNTYFSLLPFDLSSYLLQFFTLEELTKLILELINIQDFKRLFNTATFWRNNISSMAEIPQNIYENVIIIFIKLEKTYNISAKAIKGMIIAFLAKDGYDKLLYPFLEFKDDYDIAMTYAAINPYKKMIDDMIIRGANDYLGTARNAAMNGHLDVVRFMLRLANTNILKESLDYIMTDAARTGYTNIVKLLIIKGAKDYMWALQVAIAYRQRNVVDLLLNLGLVTINDILYEAERLKWIELANEMQELKVSNY